MRWIYAFAAVAMLYLALMRALKDNEKAVYAVSVGLIAVTLIINELAKPESFSTGSEMPDTLLGFFVRENEYSYFPLVSWLFFPVTGFLSGKLYRRWGRKKFLIFMAVAGTAALVPTSIIMYVNGMRCLNALTRLYA